MSAYTICLKKGVTKHNCYAMPYALSENLQNIPANNKGKEKLYWFHFCSAIKCDVTKHYDFYAGLPQKKIM